METLNGNKSLLYLCFPHADVQKYEKGLQSEASLSVQMRASSDPQTEAVESIKYPFCGCFILMCEY